MKWKEWQKNNNINNFKSENEKLKKNSKELNEKINKYEQNEKEIINKRGKDIEELKIQIDQLTKERDEYLINQQENAILKDEITSLNQKQNEMERMAKEKPIK